MTPRARLTEAEALNAFNNHVYQCEAGCTMENDEWVAFCPAGMRCLIALVEVDDDPVMN